MITANAVVLTTGVLATLIQARNLWVHSTRARWINEDVFRYQREAPSYERMVFTLLNWHRDLSHWNTRRETQ